MAKRFKMLAPFDSVSGNVSGAQKLEYPVNGQGAYDGPAGKNYAQNYKPRFIMNERKSDGRLYFQVKQRSATTITPRSKRAMAVLGGCGAIIGAILKDKTSALYQTLYEAWLVTKPVSTATGLPSSFRQYLSAFTMGALRGKLSAISVLWNNEGTPAFITINNPFIQNGTGDEDVTISTSAIAKFWSQLADNPISFTVEGLGKSVAHNGQTWNSYLGQNYNTLGLKGKEVSGASYVVFGDQFLMDGENRVSINDTMAADKVYTLEA